MSCEILDQPWFDFLVIYGVERHEVEITDTPGYWRKKEPCGGRGSCRNPIHGYVGNEGGIKHTLYYRDDARDEHGRWQSRYRTWLKARGGADDQ